jgi:hypothetical protein
MGTIDSAQFKRDGTGTGTVGTQGSFTVTANDCPGACGYGYSKVAKFKYSFASSTNLDQSLAVSAGGAGASATISFKPTTWGTQYLTVQAVDNAGNASSAETYQFYVPDDPSQFALHPGDVDGDAAPDLLGIASTTQADGTVTSDLYRYQTAAQGGTHIGLPVLAAATGDSPSRNGWEGVLIAHRGSASGTNVDDLYALDPDAGAFGSLNLYTNAYYATGGAWAYGGRNFPRDLSSSIAPPPCDSCGTAYTQTWSDVRSMISHGRHGAGRSIDQYARDAQAFADNPTGTTSSVRLADGTTGRRYRTRGGPGGILDSNGNVITFWYK